LQPLAGIQTIHNTGACPQAMLENTYFLALFAILIIAGLIWLEQRFIGTGIHEVRLFS
jgi:hypothetical protein